MDIQDISKNPQHHAYIIFSELDEGIHTKIAEDIHVIRKDNAIYMEDIEWIHTYALSQTTRSRRQVFISAPTIGVQAQNALLKILEDTQKGVFFFFFFPRGTYILPTLQSRCFMVEEVKDEEMQSSMFEKFVALSIKERITFLEDIWNKGEQERHGVIRNFLQEAEAYTHTSIANRKEEEVKNVIQCITSLREGITGGAMHKTTLLLCAYV